MATITTVELKALLRQHLGDYRSKSGDRYSGFSDPKYRLLSEAEFNALNSRVIINTIVNANQLNLASMDCDDFALLYKSFASLLIRGPDDEEKLTPCIGICWGRFKWTSKPANKPYPYHAANFVIWDDRTLHWIDASPAGNPNLGSPPDTRDVDQIDGGIRFILV